MVENLEKDDKVTPDTSTPEDKVDTISALFDERDQKGLVNGSDDVKQAEKTKKNPQSSQEDVADSEIKTQKTDSKDNSDTKDDDESSEVQILKAELEKTRKAVTDTQKYGHKNARRIKNALKFTRDLIENGTLSEEEATHLLASLENEGEDIESHEESSSEAHPFGKILKIANNELANIRKYSEDDLLDDKVQAFDYFLSVASKEDVKEALEELTDLLDSPIKLTKKMLAIGKQYYDDGYKDIKAAGGIAGYITEKNKEIDKLNKTIDKYHKKLSQYEDFDKPRYRIDETGGSHEETSGQDTLSSLFEERDKVKRR